MDPNVTNDQILRPNLPEPIIHKAPSLNFFPKFRWYRVFTVYLFLICGLLITGITAAVLFQMQPLVKLVQAYFLYSVISTTVAMTVVTSFLNKVPYEQQTSKKILFWALNSALAGIPLLNLDPNSLIGAALYTTALTSVLSISAFFIPKPVVNMTVHPLPAIHSLVLVCTMFSLLFGSYESTVTFVITSVSLHGGFLIYSTLLICNTQRVFTNIEHSRFDPVFTSFILFMNILNLYTRIAVYSSLKATILSPENVSLC